MGVKDFRRNKDYKYLRCARCDLLFLNPSPDRDELSAIYDSEFESYQRESRSLVARLGDLLAGSREALANSVSKKPGVILDVGCGLGIFVKRMSELGWSTYGFEVPQSVAKEAKARIGKDRIFSRWDEVPDNRFDVVTLWHVLEHVQNPRDLIQKIWVSLKTGGWLIIEVPNSNSFSLKIFKEFYTQHLIPEHVLYWSKHSLLYLLKEERFTISKVWCPLVIPLTFSKSLRNYIRIMGLAEIFSILSIPISIVIAFAGVVTGTGESIRVCAKKSD